MRIRDLLESSGIKRVVLELQQAMLDNPFIHDLDVKVDNQGSRHRVYVIDRSPLKLVNYVFEVCEADEEYFESYGQPYVNGLGTATPGAPDHHLINPFVMYEEGTARPGVTADRMKDLHQYLVVIETLGRLKLASLRCRWATEDSIPYINIAAGYDRLLWNVNEQCWVSENKKQEIKSVSELIEYAEDVLAIRKNHEAAD